MSESHYVPPTGPDETNTDGAPAAPTAPAEAPKDNTMHQGATKEALRAVAPPKPTAALSCTFILLIMVLMVAVATGPFFGYVAPIFAIPGFIVGILWVLYAARKNGR